MNGLVVIIIIAVMSVITVALLTIMIHYNKQLHQCDGNPLFWCHTDWICHNGLTDPNGKIVGTDGTMPMNCYIKNIMGKNTVEAADPECFKYSNANHLISNCTPDPDAIDIPLPICSGGEVPPSVIENDNGYKDPIPCTCEAILKANEYGIQAFGTGFTGTGTSGKFDMNDPGLQSCVEGDSRCISFRNVLCSQVGVQVANLNPDGTCNNEEQVVEMN